MVFIAVALVSICIKRLGGIAGCGCRRCWNNILLFVFMLMVDNNDDDIMDMDSMDADIPENDS